MQCNNKLKKFVFVILVILTVALGAVMMGVDYWRICTHNKPLFAICVLDEDISKRFAEYKTIIIVLWSYCFI